MVQMLLLVTFSAIYGIMMFIWSFVFLNRSRNQVNQAFLFFLSAMILWMILAVCNTDSDNSPLGIAIKTVYWLSMMNLSLFFLYFVYRLVRRKIDTLFLCAVLVNTLTIFARYFFPIDYQNPTFWRLPLPTVAPLMATVFCLPVALALYLIIKHYRISTDERQRTQLRFLIFGVGLSCLLSVISEYLLPALFHFNTQLYLIYLAIFILVLFIFISIMKYRLFNVQNDYIFQKLFLNASDGMVILNPNEKIISINRRAQEIFCDSEMDSGDRMTDYIPEYSYATDYQQHEISLRIGDHTQYLCLTQYPISVANNKAADATVKLLTIANITETKLCQLREKDILIEKSSTDPLTGLFTKQYFMDKFCSNRQDAPAQRLALLFIDVDNFKVINDTYGTFGGGSGAEAAGRLHPWAGPQRYGCDPFWRR